MPVPPVATLPVLEPIAVGAIIDHPIDAVLSELYGRADASTVSAIIHY